MENKRNLVSNESIAELYAFQKADNLCGVENQNSEAWNKEYNFYYNEKMEELEKEKPQAFQWWNNLISDGLRAGYAQKHLNAGIRYKFLTPKEIEEIYRKEVGDLRLHQGEIVDESYPTEFQEAYLKPNQKQFKEFSPDLFKAYIGKFSEEDKFQAFAVLAKHFENHIYGFYKDGDFDRSQNNACYGSFKSRFDTLFNS